MPKYFLGMDSKLIIPTAAEIRQQIDARQSEVRALRHLLRLATAAEAAEAARQRQRPLAGQEVVGR